MLHHGHRTVDRGPLAAHRAWSMVSKAADMSNPTMQGGDFLLIGRSIHTVPTHAAEQSLWNVHGGKLTVGVKSSSSREVEAEVS